LGTPLSILHSLFLGPNSFMTIFSLSWTAHHFHLWIPPPITLVDRNLAFSPPSLVSHTPVGTVMKFSALPMPRHKGVWADSRLLLPHPRLFSPCRYVPGLASFPDGGPQSPPLSNSSVPLTPLVTPSLFKYNGERRPIKALRCFSPFGCLSNRKVLLKDNFFSLPYSSTSIPLPPIGTLLWMLLLPFF